MIIIRANFSQRTVMNRSKYNCTCTFLLLHNLYLSPGLKGEIPKFGEVDF